MKKGGLLFVLLIFVTSFFYMENQLNQFQNFFYGEEKILTKQCEECISLAIEKKVEGFDVKFEKGEIKLKGGNIELQIKNPQNVGYVKKEGNLIYVKERNKHVKGLIRVFYEGIAAIPRIYFCSDEEFDENKFFCKGWKEIKNIKLGKNFVSFYAPHFSAYKIGGNTYETLTSCLFDVNGTQNYCVISDPYVHAKIESWYSIAKYNQSGLELGLDFDEGSGNITEDLSINKNNGTLGLGNGTFSPSWTQGKFGYGLEFNGNEFINLSSISSLSNSLNFSFGGWVYIKNKNSSIIVQQKNASGYGYYLVFNATNNESCCVSPLGNSSCSDVKTNTWIHIVCSHNSTSFSIYVNGVFKNSTNSSLLGVDENFYIGGDPINKTLWFKGVIDNLFVYNITLPEKKIEEIYKNQKLAKYYFFGDYGLVLRNANQTINCSGSVFIGSENTTSIYGNYSGLKIENCNITSGIAINLRNSERSVVKNNFLYGNNNGRIGILLESSKNLENISIVNNIISNFNIGGMYINASDFLINVTLTNNTFKNKYDLILRNKSCGLAWLNDFYGGGVSGNSNLSFCKPINFSYLNVALDKDTYSSSYYENNYPSLVADNDLETTWVSNRTDSIDQWLEIDLGEEINVSKIVIVWYYGSRSKNRTLQYSNDGINWVNYSWRNVTQLDINSTYCQNCVPDVEENIYVKARYWRVFQEGGLNYSEDQNYYSIAINEFQIFNETKVWSSEGNFYQENITKEFIGKNECGLVNITHPLNNTVYSGRYLSITWKKQSSNRQISYRLDYKKKNGNWSYIATTTSTSYLWNIYGLEFGNYTLRIVPNNGLLNGTNAFVDFGLYDYENPLLEIITPENNWNQTYHTISFTFNLTELYPEKCELRGNWTKWTQTMKQ